MFQMNCRANLTTAHVIKYNGVLWDIRCIDSWFETVLRVPDMANGKQQIRKIRDQCIAFSVVQCYNVDVKKCAIRGMAL